MNAPAADRRSSDPIRLEAVTGNELRFYQEEGYLVIPGLVAAPDAGLIRTEIMSIMDTIGLPRTALRQTSQYLRGSRIDALVNSPHLQALVSQLIGGPGTLYLPFTAVKSPGGGDFRFHQDNQYTRWDGPGINCWFSFGEIDPENGCLNMVRRSHTTGTVDGVDYEPDPGAKHRKVANDPTSFFPIRMRPGDCVAFSRYMIHGSGPNTTTEPRVGYAVQFHRDDVNALREDGQNLSLKMFPRWKDLGPVDTIVPPQETSRDGH
jgi:2-oxoglutarate-dependent dioxygenase